MLDVHPPHHAANSWRDFLIHIATIVVGLLIAIGLEQTVERIHEHYELRETREALEREQAANDIAWADDEHDWRRVFVEMKNNLLVLQAIQQRPGLPETALPGDLRWNQSPFLYNHAVWDAARQKGIVQLMPLSESNRYQEYYAILMGMSTQSLDDWNAINAAHGFDLVDSDPTHLTPEQVEQAIRLTTTALEKHVLLGYSFGRLAVEFPDRPHTMTWEVINSVRPFAFQVDVPGMAAAHAKTMERLAKANSGSKGDQIDPEALK